MQIVILYELFLFCLQLKYSPFVLFLRTSVIKQKIFLEFGEFKLEYNGEKPALNLTKTTVRRLRNHTLFRPNRRGGHVPCVHVVLVPAVT